MENDIDPVKEQIKENIQQLIEEGRLVEARELVERLKTIVKDDTEAYSMEAVIFIMENKLEDAKAVLIQGLSIDAGNFDLNYNLAYVYERAEKYDKALEYYTRAKSYCNDDKLRKGIADKINNIEESHSNLVYRNKLKIAFFVKQGMDSFLNDIIEDLSDVYETKKIIVAEYNQIDEGMQWTDICWFEWCDELVIYGSKLPIAKEKRIICRLHSYEAFTNYTQNVNWDYIDKIIFISYSIRDFVIDKLKLDKNRTVIIPNAVDLDKYTFKERKPSFNIAYVGYINYKKGPMLLLHTFKKVYDKDKRYKLYIAGKFQDERYVLYFKQMIKEFGMENNLFYQGWQDDINKWLEDKDYILCTSVLESQNVSVMQAMAKGIKPIIHNFVGAKQIYHKKYLFNTIDEAVNMVTEDQYNSREYRNYIENNYSLDMEMKSVRKVIDSLEEKQAKFKTDL